MTAVGIRHREVPPGVAQYECGQQQRRRHGAGVGDAARSHRHEPRSVGCRRGLMQGERLRTYLQGRHTSRRARVRGYCDDDGRGSGAGSLAPRPPTALRLEPTTAFRRRHTAVASSARRHYVLASHRQSAAANAGNDPRPPSGPITFPNARIRQCLRCGVLRLSDCQVDDGIAEGVLESAVGVQMSAQEPLTNEDGGQLQHAAAARLARPISLGGRRCKGSRRTAQPIRWGVRSLCLLRRA